MKSREWRRNVRLGCCHCREGGNDLERGGGGDDLERGEGGEDLERGGGDVVGMLNRCTLGQIRTQSASDQIHLQLLRALREIQRRWSPTRM
jgi:hypothetical protein